MWKSIYDYKTDGGYSYPFKNYEQLFFCEETCGAISDYYELGFCGCGDPDEALKIIKKTLQYCVDWQDNEEVYIDWLIKNVFNGVEGAAYLILYSLDNKGLTEHGSSVHGSWLTEKGKMLLNDLNKYFNENN